MTAKLDEPTLTYLVASIAAICPGVTSEEHETEIRELIRSLSQPKTREKARASLNLIIRFSAPESSVALSSIVQHAADIYAEAQELRRIANQTVQDSAAASLARIAQVKIECERKAQMLIEGEISSHRMRMSREVTEIQRVSKEWTEKMEGLMSPHAARFAFIRESMKAMSITHPTPIQTVSLNASADAYYGNNPVSVVINTG